MEKACYRCCRYRTDEKGNLIFYNANPLYVEKLYEIKEANLNLKDYCFGVDMLVKEIECRLFEDDGRMFLDWLSKNADWLKVIIAHIDRVIFDSHDTLEIKDLKTRILKMLEEFII